MTDEQQSLQFSTILASTIHDIKNALSMILNSLDDITEKLNQLEPDNSKVSLLRFETSRVNGLLVQLLALYKSEQQQLPLNIEYHNVYDFLDEQGLCHQQLLADKNLTISITADDHLEWAFDRDLLNSVINNIITNNIRYANSKIRLSASVVDKMLELKVFDDGPGYPEMMINNQNEVILGINSATGSTGLGLYFAGQVVSMHHRNDLQGTVVLSNAENSGAVFTIRIP